jgi:threonine aldolase
MKRIKRNVEKNIMISSFLHLFYPKLPYVLDCIEKPNTNIIDLRSDTVTKPTHKMRTSIVEAEVGDDVYGEDPTMNLLQKRVADMFNKEDALFFPTGTMSNLAAILAWCPTRGSEIIVGDKSHIFLYEQIGVVQFGGISIRTLPNESDGTINISDLVLAIRPIDDIHEPNTALICVENTHNVTGGKILSLEYLEELRNSTSLPIHMDGSRIWNASAALEKPVYKLVESVDTVTVCLSKGLGAPVGSLLVGPKEFIQKARRIRKALGGGMRQSGILAAAGIEALNDFESGILVKDHQLATLLYHSIKRLEYFRLKKPMTNILFIEILIYDNPWEPSVISDNIQKMFLEKNIKLSVWSPLLLRCVIHRDMTETEIHRVIQAFQEINTALFRL